MELLQVGHLGLFKSARASALAGVSIPSYFCLNNCKISSSSALSQSIYFLTTPIAFSFSSKTMCKYINVSSGQFTNLFIFSLISIKYLTIFLLLYVKFKFLSSKLQLKTVGESLDALNEITEILSGNLTDTSLSQTALSAIGEKYSLSALKQAIAQSTLNETQIKTILIKKKLKGATLETTVAELTQATAANTLAAAEATATGTTGGFSLALKGLGAQLKALIVAHPVIASIAAIGAVTFGVIKAVDYMSKSLERQKEKLASAKTNYENATSELANINSELETTRKRIEELNNIKHPSFIEQEELQRAIAYAEALELAADIASRKAQIEQENVSKENEKTFYKEYGSYVDTDPLKTSQKLLAQVSEPSDGFGIHIVASQSPSNIGAQIAAIEYFKKALENDTKAYLQALENNDQVLADEYKQRTDSWEKEIQYFQNNLNTIQETLNEYSQNAIASGDMDSTYYQQIQELQKSIYTYLDPAQWNTMKFNSIFDRKDIEVTKEELISLAEKGKLTADILKRYPALYEAIQGADFIGENGIKLFLEQIASSIKMVEDFNLTGETISDKFHLSEEQLNAFDAFQSRLADIQEAFDHLSTSKPEENFKRLLDLMKDDPNFDLTMYRSADGVIDYESALNQFRQNAVEQTIRLIPELETEILSMGNAIETAIQKAIRLGENYHEILNVLARVQSGESLTATFKDVANKHKKQYKIIKNWIP